MRKMYERFLDVIEPGSSSLAVPDAHLNMKERLDKVLNDMPKIDLIFRCYNCGNISKDWKQCDSCGRSRI